MSILSRAEQARKRSEELDDLNQHGFVKVAKLSGEHIGHGVWYCGDWHRLIAIKHEEGNTDLWLESRNPQVIEISAAYDPARSVDITAHPMAPAQTEGADRGTTDAEPDDAECEAELLSWDYFKPQQVDRYWVRCDLRGPHDEHKNSHTGAKWRDPEPPAGLS